MAVNANFSKNFSLVQGSGLILFCEHLGCIKFPKNGAKTFKRARTDMCVVVGGECSVHENIKDLVVCEFQKPKTATRWKFLVSIQNPETPKILLKI